MPHIHELIDFVVNAFIVHNGRVLLVDHRKIGQWLAPGGHVELGEDTDEALFREITEETGLTPEDVETVGNPPTLSQDAFESKSLRTPRWVDIHRVNDRHRHVGLNYVLRARTDAVRLAPAEHHEIRWFSLTALGDPTLRTPSAIRFYGREAIRLLS
ncbi:MAG: hypothetical protein A3B37_02970 [Candidatus Sungbacteria bacterium RIFCSPLOWO2_01_FULL_59_16]|uniref:Nudix hydrolase domain-containing protein n=1 Tax=Candidatus Sungbacteria bacterium RIFCSPLOWO2_01_FULL_59_16 TaxID=1802280 RepID=A0A1G2LBM5_9BACT|nr:MAG: hypothetical protein A3B37_02970 [Candidatus Sungbacteria bacterium RIFCSPLOWO2_01_FULL_59_16]